MSGALPLEELAVVMVLAVVGVPLAGILHELTHVLFVWPVAASVDLHVDGWHVEALVPETPWRQRWASLAGVAPLIVGCFVAVYLFHIGEPLRPPTEPWGILQWGLWLMYTVTGGLSDYVPEVSRSRSALTD